MPVAGIVPPDSPKLAKSVNLETLEVEEKQPKVVPLFDTQNLFYSGSTLFASSIVLL